MKRDHYSAILFAALLTMIVLQCDKKSPTENNDGPLTGPTVTTQEPTRTGDTTLQSGGTVTDDGGTPVTAYGVAWSTTNPPTLADTHTVDGAGTGDFVSQISGLTLNTTYYIRAYATNNVETRYGETIEYRLSGATITDIDGNMYETAEIGGQTWTVQNLRATHFRNGEAIPQITDEDQWKTTESAACCSYENTTGNTDVYGILYNGYVITDERTIAPAGWRVPTDEDWKTLEKHIGLTQIQADATDWRGDNNEGARLKEAGTVHWLSPNTGADNSTGFTALPGGLRHYQGHFQSLRTAAYFWTSTTDSDNLWSRVLINLEHGVKRMAVYKRNGYSVRLIKE